MDTAIRTHIQAQITRQELEIQSYKDKMLPMVPVLTALQEKLGEAVDEDDLKIKQEEFNKAAQEYNELAMMRQELESAVASCKEQLAAG